MFLPRLRYGTVVIVVEVSLHKVEIPFLFRIVGEYGGQRGFRIERAVEFLRLRFEEVDILRHFRFGIHLVSVSREAERETAVGRFEEEIEIPAVFGNLPVDEIRLPVVLDGVAES